MQQLSPKPEPALWATLTPLPTVSCPSLPSHPPAPSSSSLPLLPLPLPFLSVALQLSQDPRSPPTFLSPSPFAQPHSAQLLCSASLCCCCLSILFLPLCSLQSTCTWLICQSPNSCPAFGLHLLDCSPLSIPSQTPRAFLLHGRPSPVS